MVRKKGQRWAWYAVAVGRKPGVYDNWHDCEQQILYVSGALHEGFNHDQQAQAFVETHGPRVQVWNADGVIISKSGGCCWYCGVRLTEDFTVYGAGEIEHQQPRARGGSSALSNLVLSCRPCNERKGTRTPEEFREPGQVFFGEGLRGEAADASGSGQG